MEKETLQSNELFDVIKKDGQCGVELNQLNVLIMPYISVNNLPFSIGIVDEINPFREGGKSKTLMTCSTIEDDPDILMTAHRKLKDMSGIDVLDHERWTFLGFLSGEKFSTSIYPCFACDVTGLESTEAVLDDTKFVMVPVKDALDTDDCFIPALFMKVFRYVYGFTGNHTSDDTNKTKTEAKHVLSQDVKDKILAIEGVSGVSTDLKDDKFEVFTKSELSDDSTKQLDDIFKQLKSEYKLELIDKVE